MGNSIKPHIERAEKSGVISLCDMGLSEVPEQLLRIARNLRTLDLSSNKISVLPGNVISLFASLKHFTMNGNRLVNLPEEMGELKRLEAVSLNNNRLTSIPRSFGNLNSLKKLSLAGNRLRAFPEQLCQLTHLDSLDLSRNSIVQIPAEIRGLQAIELNLNQNQINEVSESVADCPRLKVLRLEENCLPATAFTTRILKESRISLLAIEGNLFELKQLHRADGYDQYMERYTAAKMKLT